MNKKVLVTGASGLVGSHLLIELSKDYTDIIALYRNEQAKQLVEQLFDFYNVKENFDRVKWIKGDIIDLEHLKIVFKDVSIVFHTAALVSFEKKDADKLYKVNVGGTKNVLEAIRFNKIKTLAFISSVASIRNKNSNGYFSEDGTLEGARSWTDYAKSKFESEKLVLTEKDNGLKAVIINPGVILGPGDISKSSTVIFNTIKLGLSFYTAGINGFVDVRDVVDATLHLLAMDSTKNRYVCVGKNSSFKELFFIISNALEVKAPKYKANRFLLAMAWRLELVFAKIKGREPKLTKDNTSSALEIIKYDSSLLSSELNFKFRTIDNAVNNAAAFFRFIE